MEKPKMSNFVFVLDTDKRPLEPIHPGLARQLLQRGKAAIYKKFPFTLILKESRPDAVTPDLEIKIDPGSKTTGLAILDGSKVLWVAELIHRGQAIKDALLSRRQLRRGRRNRRTRYRPARFLNRIRPQGWLAPSLMSRVHNIDTWVRKLTKLAPISSIAQELVRFDMQLMQNAEISGVEYQQGELAGYEVREYLLEKFNRQCVYCGARDTPLEIEHVHPRSRGGSDKVSNLTLACHSCNQAKGNRNVKEFLSGKPEVLKRVLAQIQAPLKDAAAVNATRWKLLEALKAKGLPVTTGSGGQTKFNRARLGLPKTHWLDAACVGDVEHLEVLTTQPLIITGMGHGSRQMCRTDKFGFPSRYVPRFKFVKGFQTGDIVKAVVTHGKKIGTHVGRVAVRSTGSFNISTANGLVQGISSKYCKAVHQKDGYGYGFL
jgi:5-methylcytosine-specific restriction endonuclease McrA